MRCRQRRRQSGSSSLLRRLEDQLLAFDAWDRWDLDRAQSLLRDHAREAALRKRFLFPIQRVIRSCDLLNQDNQTDKVRKVIKEGKIHGFEAVEDLLLNASRRASQERYDDAVGRLYRSMELTAQLLLLLDHGGIRTGNVQLELLPEDLRTAYGKRRNQEKNKILLGLTDSFDLLADLGDPVGQEWQVRRNEIVNALQARNHSLLAHGFQPVTYTEWKQLDGVLGGFLRSVLDQRRGELAPLEQLPTTLEGMALSPIG